LLLTSAAPLADALLNALAFLIPAHLAPKNCFVSIRIESTTGLAKVRS